MSGNDQGIIGLDDAGATPPGPIGGAGPGLGLGGGLPLGQLLRQKRWQQDSRLIQRSTDTQGSGDDLPPPGESV